MSNIKTEPQPPTPNPNPNPNLNLNPKPQPQSEPQPTTHSPLTPTPRSLTVGEEDNLTSAEWLVKTWKLDVGVAEEAGAIIDILMRDYVVSYYLIIEIHYLIITI